MDGNLHGGLLKLPPELLLTICDSLPLASILIFRLQVCRRLRYHDQLGPLRLPPSLSFAQWQQASETLKELGLAKQDDDADEDLDDRDHNRDIHASSPRALPKLPDVPQLRPLKSPSHAKAPEGGVAVGWNGASNLAPKAYKLEVALGVLLATGPAYEVRLFRRVLAFLGLLPPERAIPPKGALKAPDRRRPMRLPVALEERLQPTWVRSAGDEVRREAEEEEQPRLLKTLCAVSWSGISGQSLVQMLRTEPTFAGVDLIVKTERFDEDSWKTLNDPVPIHLASQAAKTATHLVDEGEYSAGRIASVLPASSSSSSSLTPSAYLETQVVVNVGSKATEEQGRHIKGQGLFAGYRAFCFNAPAARQEEASPPEKAPPPLPSEQGNPQSIGEDDEEGNRSSSSLQSGGGPAPCPSDQPVTPSVSRARPLHVVFVGRFRLDEALETEEMLFLSAMRCSACQSGLAM